MLKGVDMALYQSLLSYTPRLQTVLVPIDENGLPPADTLSRLNTSTANSLLASFEALDGDGEISDDSERAYDNLQDFDMNVDHYDDPEDQEEARREVENEMSEKTKEMRGRVEVGERIVWVGGGNGKLKEVAKAYIVVSDAFSWFCFGDMELTAF